MKRIAIFILSLASVAFADSQDLANTLVPIEPKTMSHHIFVFGPDLFWQSFGESKQNAKTESNGSFGGTRLRYEYLKTDSYYTGTDALFAVGGVNDESTVDAVKTEIKRTALAVNLEQRFGYTFSNNPAVMLTPFAGLGWYYTRPMANHDFSNDFMYAATGLKMHRQLSSVLNIGLVGKIMYSFFDRTHVKGIPNSSWDSTAWGYEINLPITVHFDLAHSWNISLESYLQDFDLANHFMNAGGRFLASCQF